MDGIANIVDTDQTAYLEQSTLGLHCLYTYLFEIIRTFTVFSVCFITGSLDEVLTIAIQRDKVKFMELILQQGVFMKEYLTIGRMEQLYSKVRSYEVLIRDFCIKDPV